TSSHQLSPTPDRAPSAGLSTPSEPCNGTVERDSLVQDLVKERVSQQKKRKLGRRLQGPLEERLEGRHFLLKKTK
ncbi:hypothetical protein J6590_107857, partial [Homalodisca vitripennis]